LPSVCYLRRGKLKYTEMLMLYGYETWSITLSKDHRLRVFDRRVLIKVPVPKRKAVTGDWKRTAS
jgi:hypothetical protein